MRIAVKNLRPNPFRHLERYPIDQLKVDALKKSIRETSFWDNVLVRPSKNGHAGEFELAYGHHRYIALKKLGVEKIDVPCRDLDDTTMAKIMAYENQEEWGTNAKVEMETIRSIVEGFAEGRIHLPKIQQDAGRSRLAPSFVSGGWANSGNRELLYSAETLAKFTGKETARVELILNALAAAEKDLINTEDLKDLTTHQAVSIAREVSRIAKETDNEGLARKIGKRLAHGMRSTTGRPITGPGGPRAGEHREVTIKTARRMADEMAGKRAVKKEKVLPPIERFCEQLADALVDIPSDAMRAKLDAIVENREHLRGQDQRLIVGALRGLLKRVEKYIDKLEG